MNSNRSYWPLTFINTHDLSTQVNYISRKSKFGKANILKKRKTTLSSARVMTLTHRRENYSHKCQSSCNFCPVNRSRQIVLYGNFKFSWVTEAAVHKLHMYEASGGKLNHYSSACCNTASNKHIQEVKVPIPSDTKWAATYLPLTALCVGFLRRSAFECLWRQTGGGRI